MVETYLSLSSSTTSQLPQDRPVCLLALNSSTLFHKTYKHNCKPALPTCVYTHLTVSKCFCALLNRDLWKQMVESFLRCWSVLSMGTAHSQSQTPYVVTLPPILCRVLFPPLPPWSHKYKRTLPVLLKHQHLCWYGGGFDHTNTSCGSLNKQLIVSPFTYIQGEAVCQRLTGLKLYLSFSKDWTNRDTSLHWKEGLERFLWLSHLHLMLQ